MANYSSILTWKIPDEGACWATTHGVTELETNEHTHAAGVPNLWDLIPDGLRWR